MAKVKNVTPSLGSLASTLHQLGTLPAPFGRDFFMRDALDVGIVGLVHGLLYFGAEPGVNCSRSSG